MHENIDDLETVVLERCRNLLEQTELIQGLTNYYWWPEDAI